MNLLGYRFEPRLWAIAITIVSVIIFIELGKWQLSRAEEKSAQFEQLEQYAKQPAVLLPGTLVKLKDFQYRDVEVSGEYLPEHTIYLDNKTYHGRAGYHVITPLKILNSALHVAVNRGWVATGSDRSVLPAVAEVSGEVKITGIAASPEIRTLELSDRAIEGQVWDNFDLQRYQEVTGLTLQPLMLLQKSEEKDGLIRDWSKPDSGASKNIGYAVQWFSLAATAVIIFIVLNVKRKNSKNKQT
ncbi:MAG: SURF1 family protein [Nitrosomonas sp.]|jgi:surfeit locus 1 family protein|nr:SURF1 family protein [Nitrosomonas sp.]MBP9099933.1 SURF1 family protein [Nitrosomonas sp.]